jgi:hypothetical protein
VALAPEGLAALSPEERRKVYVILNLTVEPWSAEACRQERFGEEQVWEDVGTSRRSFADANPATPTRLQFTLISKNGGLETAFKLEAAPIGA